jgi:hypothetical protein
MLRFTVLVNTCSNLRQKLYIQTDNKMPLSRHGIKQGEIKRSFRNGNRQEALRWARILAGKL